MHSPVLKLYFLNLKKNKGKLMLKGRGRPFLCSFAFISVVVRFHLSSYRNVRGRDCSLPLSSMLFFSFYGLQRYTEQCSLYFPKSADNVLTTVDNSFFQAGLWMPAEIPFWNMIILINIAKYKIHHWWDQLINLYFGKNVRVKKLFLCVCLGIATAMPKN